MFHWEPEGHHHHTLCTARAPFWFSTEDRGIVITPFWLSTNDIFSWESELGPYNCSSKMFHWEPEGRYRCTASMTIVPFWFSMEHHWKVITPFWLSTNDINTEQHLIGVLHNVFRCHTNFENNRRLIATNQALSDNLICKQMHFLPDFHNTSNNIKSAMKTTHWNVVYTFWKYYSPC